MKRALIFAAMALAAPRPGIASAPQGVAGARGLLSAVQLGAGGVTAS